MILISRWAWPPRTLEAKVRVVLSVEVVITLTIGFKILKYIQFYAALPSTLTCNLWARFVKLFILPIMSVKSEIRIMKKIKFSWSFWECLKIWILYKLHLDVPFSSILIGYWHFYYQLNLLQPSYIVIVCYQLTIMYLLFTYLRIINYQKKFFFIHF